MIACLTIILDIACKVCSNKFIHNTSAATDNLYPLGFKHILCTLPHVAGQHNCHAHLSQNGSDTALASASFRRSHLADICHLSVNDIKYRIVCAITEVVIYASVSCWYCYLHCIID